MNSVAQKLGCDPKALVEQAIANGLMKRGAAVVADHRRGPKPGQGGMKPKYDWAAIDWRMNAKQIALVTGAAINTVYAMRQKYCPKTENPAP